MKYTLTSLLFFLFCHCSKSYETNWQSAFSGNGEWKSVKIYGGSNEDVAHSIIKTNDGGFAVIGNTKSNNGDLKFKTTEDSDILFIKFNSDEKIEFIGNKNGMVKKIYNSADLKKKLSVIEKQNFTVINNIFSGSTKFINSLIKKSI